MYAEFAIENTEVTNDEKSLAESKFAGCIFVSAMYFYDYLILNVEIGAVKFFSYIYVSEYPAAANCSLAVPTPEVSLATTPVFDTKLVIEVSAVLYPYPNIALSPP
jgi:hypothetical protein